MNDDLKVGMAVFFLLCMVLAVIFASSYIDVRNKAECRQIMAQKSATEIIAICGVLK
jgi:hypothetical protein